MDTQPDILPFPELPPKPKKPLAPKAPQREKPEAPQLQGRFRNTGVLTGLGIGALAVAGPLGLLIAGGAAAFGIYDATTAYEEREKKYLEDKLRYETVEFPRWKFEMEEWRKNKEHLMKTWKQECQQLETDWQVEKERRIAEHNKRCQELLTSEEIFKWRVERLHHLVHSHVSPSDARHGRLDDVLLNALKKFLPNLNVRWMEGLAINSERLYTPDVIVHDPETNIWIDVEIDEPWFDQEGRKIPCHMLGSDDYRDEFFTEHGWIVIRFAESQVLQSPVSCVKVVAEVLSRFKAGNSFNRELEDVPNLEPVERWNEFTALDISR